MYHGHIGNDIEGWKTTPLSFLFRVVQWTCPIGNILLHYSAPVLLGISNI